MSMSHLSHKLSFTLVLEYGVVLCHSATQYNFLYKSFDSLLLECIDSSARTASILSSWPFNYRELLEIRDTRGNEECVALRVPAAIP